MRGIVGRVALAVEHDDFPEINDGSTYFWPKSASGLNGAMAYNWLDVRIRGQNDLNIVVAGFVDAAS